MATLGHDHGSKRRSWNERTEQFSATVKVPHDIVVVRRGSVPFTASMPVVQRVPSEANVMRPDSKEIIGSFSATGRWNLQAL